VFTYLLGKVDQEEAGAAASESEWSHIFKELEKWEESEEEGSLICMHNCNEEGLRILFVELDFGREVVEEETFSLLLSAT